MAAALEGMPRVQPRSDAWPAIETALRTVPSRVPRSTFWSRPMWWAGGLGAAAVLSLSLLVPGFHTRISSPEPDMRAFAPAVAAGLGVDRSQDPLLKMQYKLDRLLDRVSNEGS